MLDCLKNLGIWQTLIDGHQHEVLDHLLLASKVADALNRFTQYFAAVYQANWDEAYKRCMYPFESELIRRNDSRQVQKVEDVDFDEDSKVENHDTGYKESQESDLEICFSVKTTVLRISSPWCTRSLLLVPV